MKTVFRHLQLTDFVSHPLHRDAAR